MPVLGDLPVVGQLFRSTPEAAGGSGNANIGSRTAPPAGGGQEVAAFDNAGAILERQKSNAGSETLVHDGKLLYEMGKLDEADAKLKLALKENPHNEAALYYLNLASEAKHSQAAKTHEVTMRQDSRPVELAWASPAQRESLPVPNPRALTPAAAAPSATDQNLTTGLDAVVESETHGGETRGKGVYSVDVVGYGGVPLYGGVTSGAPAGPATVERYTRAGQPSRLNADANGASRVARSPIVLPSAQPETSLARLNNGPSINVGQGFFYSKASPDSQNSWVRNFTVGGESFAAANQAGAAPAALEDKRKQGAEDAEKRRLDERLPAGTLDLEQADLDQVLELYGRLVNRKVLRPPSASAAPISLREARPLTKQEAIQTLDAALAQEGITMVTMGDKDVKALPEAKAAQPACPQYWRW